MIMMRGCRKDLDDPPSGTSEQDMICFIGRVIIDMSLIRAFVIERQLGQSLDAANDDQGML
jgi:hypothetical protein